MRLALALLAAASLLLSCDPGRPFSYCDDNADCETSLTCFENQCLSLGPLPADLVWEVRLPGEPHAQVLASPQRTQPLPFVLCSSQVTGDLSELGPARVDIRGAHPLLPKACVSEQRHLEGAFSLPLPPGTYQMTFHQEGRPPLTERFEVEACSIQALGTIERGATTTLRFLPIFGEGDPRPRCGIRAAAFDPATGIPLSRSLDLQLDARYQCSPPTSDGWELEVALPATGAEVALVLESASATSPVMRRLVVPIQLEPERTVVGAIPTRSAPAERAVFLVEDDNGHPVDGVRIATRWPEVDPPSSCLQTARAGQAWGEESFRSAVARPTGTPGAYELWLPPGPHAFEAIPPQATHLAIGRPAPSWVREGGGNLFPIRLPQKPRLSGTVQGRGQGPVAAKVTAMGLDPGTRTFETRADARGRYELGVDVGRYALIVDVEGEIFDRSWAFLGKVEEDRAAPLTVSAPRVVAGTLHRQALDRGADSVGSEEEENEEGPPAPPPFYPRAHLRVWDVSGETPILAGETVSDEKGKFVLRVSGG